MFNAKATIIASAALALAACSGGSGVSNLAPSNALPASQSMRASTTSPTPVSPGLLYIASAGTVYVYNQIGMNQTPIDQITGFGTVRGLHVAANGDLSVSDQNTGLVSIYHQGEHTPFKQLSSLSNPGRIAVDSKGTVYVSNTGDRSVYVFANGSTTPTSTLTDSFHCTTSGVAIDASDDLFVSSGCGVIDEFPAGQTTPTALGSSFGFPTDIAMDHNGNLITTDVSASKLSVYAPPYNQAPTQVSENFDVIYAIALGGDKAIWYADSSKQYGGKWSYPGLKLLPVHTSTQGLDTTLDAIAAYPPGGN
jgi:hypothetical protein